METETLRLLEQEVKQKRVCYCGLLAEASQFAGLLLDGSAAGLPFPVSHFSHRSIFRSFVFYNLTVLFGNFASAICYFSSNFVMGMTVS